MNRSLVAFLLLFLHFFLDPAGSQSGRHFPTPPEGQNTEAGNDPQPALTRHLDLIKAQAEADELARAAQTIPGDVANMRKGTLPKDVIEKLKQIEKLSKHLRSELTP